VNVIGHNDKSATNAGTGSKSVIKNGSQHVTHERMVEKATPMVTTKGDKVRVAFGIVNASAHAMSLYLFVIVFNLLCCAHGQFPAELETV